MLEPDLFLRTAKELFLQAEKVTPLIIPSGLNTL